MSLPMVIYHGGCSDGWCAAYTLHKCMGGVDMVPAFYGQEPPCVDNRSVVMVDFSYKRDAMERMHADASSFICLDHHVTAREQLYGLSYCVFDELESGATLAIRFAEQRGFWFNLTLDEQAGIKELAKYVKDRDLWQWKVPESREMNCALRSYPMAVTEWDKLAYRISRDPKSLINEGIAITRYRNMLIKSHVKHAKPMNLFGHNVPVVECSAGELASDVLQELAKGNPFAASWFSLGEEAVVSLRSDDAGLDVGQLAKGAGGGGHVHAAGFRTSFMTWVLGNGES